MTLSLDTQAILLLCSRLGLSSGSEIAPLTLKDWNALTKKLQALTLQPADLLGRSAEDIQNLLMANNEQTERIAFLLQRSGSLAIELERLASLGIHVLTCADNDYPGRYRQRLKESAPLVLFYSGKKSLLGQPGIAVVGSRRLDVAGQECAGLVGNACGVSGLVLYSGGAKGVDSISTKAALTAGGSAVGILAESLEKAIRDPENRAAISRGDLCLVTAYSPSAPFSVGAAMGRNRLIYTIADYAIVVASDAEKGGTWAGAVEALRAKWVPVFVLEHPTMHEGNKMLLQKGATGFPHPFTEDQQNLCNWLEAHAAKIKPELQQPGLF